MALEQRNTTQQPGRGEPTTSIYHSQPELQVFGNVELFWIINYDNLPQ